MTLSSDDLNIFVSGDAKVNSKNGIFTFDSVFIAGKPKYTSKIKFLASGIDSKRVKVV